MNTVQTIITASIGLAAGATIGMLAAPRSGKKTRKMINDEFNSRMNRIENEAEKKVAELKKAYNEGVRSYTKNGKELLDKTRETVTLN